uniref:DUF433 domain-containing protein n=1 Tax=Siphoviridae sp. ctZHD14 TaxID=2827891 RepID=A0A8S5SWL3_9CAUD|nr:MAG TPA: Protein of unknown function (DUF433) [Siphoviridae sp. ctZHD14]
MAVSALGFKVIKNAIQIRLNRGEFLEEILASYPKLSTEQTNIARKEFENYTPKEGE